MKDITVIIATSPLPSHPGTHIIDETLSTIRTHLPDSEILLCFDGVREEQSDRAEAYNEYKTTMLWRCLHQYENVLPIIFEEHLHQSGMIRQVLDTIRTPLLLYVEGDAPLTPDLPIDWQKCVDYIMDGHANTIRFHHENVLPKEHEPLMLGEPDHGFRKTFQWSQRPHLSTVAYYRDVVIPTLPERSFIEDSFHGTVQNDYYRDGMIGWYKHRLVIYYPKGGIKRSYHLDGREGGRKFTSDDEVWQK